MIARGYFVCVWVLCLTWQASGGVIVAFQVRAHRLVASPRFGSPRWGFAAFDTRMSAYIVLLATVLVGRSYTRLFQEVAIPQSLFADILGLIADLRPPPDHLSA